jgi:hypothetical protein
MFSTEREEVDVGLYNLVVCNSLEPYFEECMRSSYILYLSGDFCLLLPICCLYFSNLHLIKILVLFLFISCASLSADLCFVPYAGIGNLLAVFLFPTLIYYFRLGATGAAISTVVSQYVLFWIYLLLPLFFLALFDNNHARKFVLQIHCYLLTDLAIKQESCIIASEDGITSIWWIYKIW